MIGCVFCDRLGSVHQGEHLVAENRHAAALRDGHPVSDGHTLVVPRRHVLSVFELGGEEQQDVWNLVAEVRDHLRTSLDLPPDAFNVGPNDGEQAGQTVMHAHVHVIPRYQGDVPDPRGGIRWVLPRKANYWEPDKADPFQQVEFLGFIQSIFEHGEFVSTYKFALLQALADLSLELDPEPDGTLRVSLQAIASKFIGYYWAQAASFHLAGGEAVILQQNTGPKNAAIVGMVAEMRAKHSTLSRAKVSRGWRSLVSEVGRQVKLMPLFKLQTIGRKQTETLYLNQLNGGFLTLHKGVQDCFRRFYGIVVRLCRREWLDMVRKLNKATIGAPLDLAEFLFGSERNQWPGLRPLLRELQDGKCFYCLKPVVLGQEELDYFIPWSLYPNDLVFNFVLACRRCNNAKRDSLPDEAALERWIERNKLHGNRIESQAGVIGLAVDANASRRVAEWAYKRAPLGR